MSLTNLVTPEDSRIKYLEALMVDKRPIPHVQTTEPLESLELEVNKVVKVGTSLDAQAKQTLL